MADLDTSFYTKSNPNALFDTAQGAMAVRNAQAQNALLGVGLQQQQQDLVKSQVGYLTNGFSALASKPDLSQQDFVNFGQRALQEGIISPDVFQAELANVAAAGNDPNKLRGLANGYLVRAQSAGDQFAIANGGVAPSAGGSPVQYTGPTGATITTTARNFADSVNEGASNPLTASPAPAQGSGNPMTSSQAPVTPATPVPLAPLPATTGPAGGIAGPTPQLQAQFNASSAQQQADKTADADYVASIVPLKKVLSGLSEAPLFGTGSGIPSEIAKTLATFGVPQAALQAKDSSELEKYLTQIARSSGAAPNAVAQLEAAMSANPNMSTDRAAAKDVVGTMLALSRLQHLKVQTLGDIAPQDYSTQASKWAQNQDPRALAMDLMDDQAKQSLRADLEKASPAVRQRFINTFNAAKAAGIFDQ